MAHLPACAMMVSSSAGAGISTASPPQREVGASHQLAVALNTPAGCAKMVRAFAGVTMTYHDQSSPPEDESFTSISSGVWHTCGLREDGIAICWGNDFLGQSSPPKNERFLSTGSGYTHSCGLREDGVIVCWGSNQHGQSSPPLR